MNEVTATNEKDKSLLPDYCTKQTLILGCGNRLFGDDGFGPAVIDHLLSHYTLPEDVYVADVGTGVRKLLFTLCLSAERPRRIIIIDAVDKGRTPGELFEIPVQEIPKEKSDDFSLHQVPSSNMVRELMEAGVDVRVIACQVGRIPATVEPGLTEAVARAVPQLCTRIANDYLSEKSR
jgi:coenzyme F420 hydrogenase subunit delta